MSIPRKFSRSQQQRLDKLQPVMDRVVEADRLFFERFPDRKHRIRLSSSVEVEQSDTVFGGKTVIPEGLRLFTIVRKVPFGRMRVYTLNKADAETDVSEVMAANIFNNAASPFQKHMLEVVEAKAKKDGLT